ncbi:hypothetical protein EDD18DRAFT_1156315 [Armillaria luteobubalina]|uniref:Uncharacterized protein n=1 Tax=Armillaria luteobubalina TaxID=153913 RepID=A0AA39Q8W6_9AGAR|nr:hypothetical protein EDD18DRAFT_1156315 [Armillaria luteobubalina]
MQTRLSELKRAGRTGQSWGGNRSLSPDPVPAIPSNHSSDDDSFEDGILPVHRASQPVQMPQKAGRGNCTPYARGSASHRVVELQTQDGQNHKIDEADAYLKDDLRHRIFIEFETFVINILHLPADWCVSLELDIAAVQKDEKFRASLGAYRCLYDMVGTGIEQERELYHAHANLCNHVVHLLQGRLALKVRGYDLNRLECIDPYVVRGSTTMAKPGIVSVLCILFSTPQGIEADKFIKTIGDKSKESKSTRKHADYISG